MEFRLRIARQRDIRKVGVRGVEIGKREAAVPVLIAAGYPWLSEGLQIGELAARFPDVTFIASNGGQINVSGLGQSDSELALERCPNLYVQTAGVYREDFLENVVARFGAERLLFASGFPTTVLRPTMTTCFPGRPTPWPSRISSTARPCAAYR